MASLWCTHILVHQLQFYSYESDSLVIKSTIRDMAYFVMDDF